MATCHGSRGRGLSTYGGLAEGRTIWSDKPRRAATSIPSNIAEGKGRASDREFIKFLNYARGSLYEVQTQIKVARRLNYLATNAAQALETQAAEVGKVLNGLIHAVTAVNAK